MERFNRLPLAKKLTMITMVTSTLALVLACVGFGTYEMVTFRQSLMREATTLAEIVASNSAASLVFDDPSSAEEILKSLSAERHISAACLFTPEGRVFASFVRKDITKAYPQIPDEDGIFFEDNHLLLFRQIVLDQEKVGTVFIQFDTLEIRSRLVRYAGIVGMVFGISLLFTFLLSSKLQQLISAPILYLARMAKAVSIGKDYSLRAVKHNQDELGQLADGFNEMLERIQRRDRKLQQHRDHLEEEVAKRVSELTQTNSRLRNEIEERRRTESEMERLRLHNELILNAAGEGLYGLDLNGNTTFLNPAAAKMIGWEVAELIGKPRHAVLHHSRPDGSPYPREECPIYAAFKDGSVHFVDDEVFWKKDGTSFPVEYVSSPIRDEQGDLIGAVVVFRDITEQIQVMQALRQSEERMKSILDTAADGIITIDETGLIELFNPAAERIFGFAQKEILGKNIRTLMPAQFPDAHGESLSRYLRTREKKIIGKTLEVVGKRQDGTTFPMELAISEMKAGTRHAFTGVVRDVTERKRAQEELMIRERELENNKLAQDRNAERLCQVVNELDIAKHGAEDAVRAKGEFLSMMSHEIRTPMNGVIGMMGLLMDTELDIEQRGYAEAVRSSADALLTIINDILDFSKIEAGKLSIEPIPFDMRHLVEDVAEMVGFSTTEEDLDLIVRYDPDAPSALIGDSGRIRQILANLVGNAVKFTKNGHVMMRVECQDKTPGDVKLRISVQDTGIGVPEDKIDYIFTKFTQADTSTTRKFGGTGLGLAISKQLVEIMKGEIGANSRLGEGSTFWFTLRLPLNTKASPEPGPAAELKLNGLRVLIVDDNECSGNALAEQISHWGLRADLFTSGEEALRAARNASEAGVPYRIALVDQKMPAMDGEAVGKAFKIDAALRAKTKLVILTRSNSKEEVSSFMEAGFAAYLTKPFRRAQLLEILTFWGTSRNQDFSVGQDAAITLAPSLENPAASSASAEAATRGRILVAEDNVVNQKVAVRMLEKIGCRVDVAANGQEAVEMVKMLPYHMVLMDCQMPVLDGYEATAAIRRLEGNPASIPIVAMTAHAMQGDREKCLAAGMDDYISKPVLVDELRRIVTAYVSGGRSTPPRGKENGKMESAKWEADKAALLKRMDGDEELLYELIDLFLTNYPGMFSEIQKAVASNDSQAVMASAHALKGAVSNFLASEAQDAAFQLEKIGKSGDLAEAGDAVATLQKELARVESGLAALRGNGSG